MFEKLDDEDDSDRSLSEGSDAGGHDQCLSPVSGRGNGKPWDWEVTFRRLYPQLLKHMQYSLRKMPPLDTTAEDVVMSAFGSMFRAVSQNRLSGMTTEDDFFRVILSIAMRKVCNSVRRGQSQKRGGQSDADGKPRINPQQSLSDSEEPVFISDAELKVMLKDELDHLLKMVGDTDYRGLTAKILALKLQGQKHSEIAEIINISVSSVERKLRIVRGLWEQGQDQSEEE